MSRSTIFAGLTRERPALALAITAFSLSALECRRSPASSASLCVQGGAGGRSADHLAVDRRLVAAW